MLTRLKYKIEKLLLALGRVLAAFGFTPNIATIASFLFAVISGILYFRGSASLNFAALCLLLSGIFDMLDGAIARATSRVSKFGGVLDSVVDRAGELIIYSGVILGGFTDVTIGLLALSSSLLVSYTRARVEAEGLALVSIGLAERAERLIILFMSTVIHQIQWGLIVIIVLSIVTLAQRLSYAYTNLRR